MRTCSICTWAAAVAVCWLATRPAACAVLFDPAVIGTPDAQGFLFAPNGSGIVMQQLPGGQAELDTLAGLDRRAGFFTHEPFLGQQGHPGAIALDRTAGYTVRFDLQMLAEQHAARDDNGDGKSDRAGFSVVAVSADLGAVELSFMHDDPVQAEVWAYDYVALGGGTSEFVQAEGAQRTTAESAALTTFDLAVLGNAYRLFANGSLLLQGPVRDFSAWPGVPFGAGLTLDPYDKPNLLFLGDDTTSASAHVNLGKIEVLPYAVPEPGAAALAGALLLGLAGHGALRRRSAGRR